MPTDETANAKNEANEAVNFKSDKAYNDWLAYGHMHDKFHGKQKVTIKGKAHKVNHAGSGKGKGKK